MIARIEPTCIELKERRAYNLRIVMDIYWNWMTDNLEFLENIAGIVRSCSKKIYRKQ